MKKISKKAEMPKIENMGNFDKGEAVPPVPPKQGQVVSDAKLEELAKGAITPEDVGFVENYWTDNSKNTREFVHFRRDVRRGIYKIVKYMKRNENEWWQEKEHLKQLFDIIDPQLDANRGLRWTDFASKWDIHPKIGTQVIIKEHWVKAGGGFDVDLGYHYPHAFTAKD